MSYSGLRGAVAFYLALNVNSEFKDMIIAITISLIIITIVFLGGTTTCLLKAMAKYFPEDGIFHSDDAEDMLLRREERHSGMSESLYEKERVSGASQDNAGGLTTGLEKLNKSMGKFLKKDKWDNFDDDDEPEFHDKYDYQNDSFSPDQKDDPYGGLSNYQKSISKYLNDAHVHLGYQDKKSVRLSLRSEARNRNPNGRHSIMRKSYRRQEGADDPYALRFNSSRRMQAQRSYFLPQTREQLGELGPSNQNELLRPNRGFSDPERQGNNRMNANIRVGALEDITSKGSHSDSKAASNQRSNKDQNNPIEEDQSRIHSFKEAENPTEERKASLQDSKKRVNFADEPTHFVEEGFISREQVDSKEPMNNQKAEQNPFKQDDEEKDDKKDKNNNQEEVDDQNNK